MDTRHHIENILVFSFSHIGDAVLSTAAIPPLQESFPDATINVLVGPVARKVFEGDARINEVIIYDNRNTHAGLNGKLKLINELKADISTGSRDICLIDETLEELPKTLIELDVLFVKGNPTNEDTLKQANVPEASHVIILSKDPGNPHSDDQNLSTTLVIEDLNPDIFSITEVVDPKKTRQIEIAGCDSTVCVSEMSTNLIIQELQDPVVLADVLQYITIIRILTCLM